MIDPNSTVSEHEDRVNKVIAEYLESVRQGRMLNREDLLRRHPDLAADLRSFFTNQDCFDSAAAAFKPAEDPQAAPTAPPSESTAPPPEGKPDRLGDFELLGEIARGGMGIVYRARQISLNRIVALKMILSGQFASAEEVARFQREAKAAAGLDHEQIVPIYQVGEDHGRLYYTMKLIEGVSLAKDIPHFQTESRAAHLLAQVARAVHHAHQHGLLHRDLKPANILLDSEKRPHVTDFGLAKRLEGASHHTTSGAIVGTVDYMSPEQAQGKSHDLAPASDVFSLGAILYEILTGQPPFQSETTLQTLVKVIGEEPKRPRLLNRAISRDLEAVCLKCLEKNPQWRYSSAEALAQDLERWQARKPVAARPRGRVQRWVRWASRRPALASATAAAALLLVVLVLGGTLISLQLGQLRQAELDKKVTNMLLVIGQKTGPPGPAELKVLEDLAESADDDVRLGFLKKGLEKASGRLERRADMVMVAVVGLSPERRKKALAMVQGTGLHSAMERRNSNPNPYPDSGFGVPPKEGEKDEPNGGGITLLPGKPAPDSNKLQKLLMASLISKLKPLVNKLKHPLCVGPARDLILQELSRRAERQFDTIWDFVTWGEKNGLGAELRSPWQRPDASALFNAGEEKGSKKETDKMKETDKEKMKETKE